MTSTRTIPPIHNIPPDVAPVPTESAPSSEPLGSSLNCRRTRHRETPSLLQGAGIALTGVLGVALAPSLARRAFLSSASLGWVASDPTENSVSKKGYEGLARLISGALMTLASLYVLEERWFFPLSAQNFRRVSAGARAGVWGVILMGFDSAVVGSLTDKQYNHCVAERMLSRAPGWVRALNFLPRFFLPHFMNAGTTLIYDNFLNPAELILEEK